MLENQTVVFNVDGTVKYYSNEKQSIVVQPIMEVPQGEVFLFNKYDQKTFILYFAFVLVTNISGEIH